MVKNSQQELALMLEDMRSVDPVFAPSSYWKEYHGPSLDFIAQNGIKDFRSGRMRQWSAFSAFVNPYVQEVEDLLAKLSQETPRNVDSEVVRMLKKLTSLCDRQYEQAAWLCLEWCRKQDRSGVIDRMGDSGLGNPSFAIQDGGHLYTIPFLRYCAYYLHLQARMPIRENMNILEIGGGYGGLCEVFAKAQPSAKYIYIDLPVQTYLAQQYLSEVFPGRVLPYSVTRSMDQIDLTKIPPGTLITLCPWQLPKLRGNFDLLLNTSSFQEMSQQQVSLYAEYVTALQTNYVFIIALMQGIRSQPTPEGHPFEPNPVKREHYLSFFNSYEIANEDWPDFLPLISKANRSWGSLLLKRRL